MRFSWEHSPRGGDGILNDVNQHSPQFLYSRACEQAHEFRDRFVELVWRADEPYLMLIKKFTIRAAVHYSLNTIVVLSVCIVSGGLHRFVSFHTGSRDQCALAALRQTLIFGAP